MTSSLVATLDRTKTSDEAAFRVIAETSKSLGHDIEEIALNRSSIRRQRMKSRKQ